MVEFHTSKMFYKTSRKHFKNKKIKEAFDAFLLVKSANPMEQFGSKDYPMRGKGPLNGVLHAGLTNDVSVFYQIKGKNPTNIYFYAIASHDEIGVGQPPNRKRQRMFKKKIDNTHKKDFD